MKALWGSTATAQSILTKVLDGGELLEFFLNNQSDALIIFYSVIKLLHVSSIFSVHHQEFSTVHSELVSFMQVSDGNQSQDGKFHPDSAWKRSSETCMKLTSFTVEES